MLLVFVVLSSFSSWASSGGLIQFYPKRVWRNEVVQFKPVSGHHFSMEAPQKCGSGRVVERSARVVSCQFSVDGEVQGALNVCDDQKTYCKPVSLLLTVAAKTTANGKRAALVGNQNLNQELKRRLTPGFEEGRLDQIRAKAAERGAPVFVMISTDWCPPCNEAKEHLLPSEAFKKVSRDWFKVYVDGDSLGASEWGKAVPYNHYPSFVLLNPSLQEVARFTGELRQADFTKWAVEASALVKDPIPQVKTRVLARLENGYRQRIRDLLGNNGVKERREDQVRLLKWSFDMGDTDLSERILSQGAFPEIEADVLSYRLRKLESEGRRDEVGALYERLLSLTLKGDDWSENLAAYCSFDVKACEPAFKDIPARLGFLKGRVTGLTEGERASMLGEEYYYLTMAYEMVGKTNEERRLAEQCVREYEGVNAASVLKMSRSGYQGMVACLEAAERFRRAEEILRSLIDAYPMEPTFLNRMARLQKKQKRYDAALGWLKKAESVSYGYNWFGMMALKADTLIEMKRYSEARQVVNEAIAQLVLSPHADTRDQVLASRLRSIEAKVEGFLK
ncbi:MAG: hypothetical protein HC902_10105 [Calothrix sp. SM1_5_4]|nr:hypothetical protein [Calothrix sp. SM1_5_4]